MDEKKEENININVEKTETAEVETTKVETPKVETPKAETTKIETKVVVEGPKKDRKGFCITSMVLGIVALVFFCVWYISIPCAILAIIFGILGIKSKGKGMAIAGLVTGSIGLVVSVLIIVFIVIFGVAVGLSETLDNYDDDYKSYKNYDWFDYE